VRDACAHADAAVVGSALVQTIADAGARGDDPAPAAGALVRWLRGTDA
jgi:tryptophan synthase alpha subunit